MLRIYTKKEVVPAVAPLLWAVSSAQIAEHKKRPLSNSDIKTNLNFYSQKPINHETQNLSQEIQIETPSQQTLFTEAQVLEKTLHFKQ